MFSSDVAGKVPIDQMQGCLTWWNSNGLNHSVQVDDHAKTITVMMGGEEKRIEIKDPLTVEHAVRKGILNDRGCDVKMSIYKLTVHGEKSDGSSFTITAEAYSTTAVGGKVEFRKSDVKIG